MKRLINIYFKSDNNFAGVGAGHAREYLGRGHGPLLQLILFVNRIGIIFTRYRQRLGRYLLWVASVLTLFALFSPVPVHAEYGDVILNKRAEKAGMRPVIFPHWFHRIRFNCAVCHTEIGFKMRAGANNMLMADIINGKFCGACHNNQIAWGPENCHLCHSGLPGLQSGIRGGDTTDGPGKW